MKKTILFLIAISISPILWCQNADINNSISIGEVIDFDSKILEEKRQIYIYKPQGFWGMDDSITNLPVIYVLDGESQFNHTVATVDFLSSAPLGNDIIPRSLVVGIPNTNRNRDLTPINGIIANDSTSLAVTGGGKKFLQFITEELIPYIDKTYSTSNHRTIIGHSLGGLMVFEALLRNRSSFNNYISIDPGFGFADEVFMREVLDTLDNTNLSKENIFVSLANTRPTFLSEQDLLFDTSDIMQLMDLPNRKFLLIADSNDWKINIDCQYYPKENHFSVPLKSTYDGLRKLYDFYRFPEIIDYYHPRYITKTDLVQKIKDHYEIISENMGYRAVPMEGYINSFAFGIAPSGRKDLAISLFEYNIELHPNQPNVYNNLGYFYKSQGNLEEAINAFKASLQIKNDALILGLVNELSKELIDQEHSK